MLDFIYAPELKKKYEVFGRFYFLKFESKVLDCRSHVEIRAISSKQKLPDAVVVMMNPGSSEPEDKGYRPPQYNADAYLRACWESDMVPARPDSAQYQIMRLMGLRGWNFVRILNLSDLRDGDSGSFGVAFQEACIVDPKSLHCITSEGRKSELSSSLRVRKGGVIISAWGTKPELETSARTFLARCVDTMGLKLDHPWYRYASPRQKELKLDWLEKINNVIESA